MLNKGQIHNGRFNEPPATFSQNKAKASALNLSCIPQEFMCWIHNPLNVTFFGSGVIAGVIYQDEVNMTGVLVRGGNLDTDAHREKAIWRWRQRPGDASINQRRARISRKPPEGEWEAGDRLLTALGRNRACLSMSSLDPGLPASRMMRQYISAV